MAIVREGDRVQVTCAIQRPDGTELEDAALRGIRYWITAGQTSKHLLVGLALLGMEEGEEKHVNPIQHRDEPTVFKIEVVAIKPQDRNKACFTTN